MKPGLRVKTTRSLADIAAALRTVATVDVLVGFPADTTERDDDVPVTNAALAYIHDNGQPEENIPARPFMLPAIEGIKDEIRRRLVNMAKAGAQGDMDKVAQQATALGLKAKLAIQNKINEGIEPALAESTLRARARRGRKGAQKELNNRANGEAPSTALAKPLVDTAQMRNAANYAIRNKSARKT